MNKRRMIELIVFLLIMLGICVSVMIVDAFANQLEKRKDNSNVVVDECNYIIDQFDDQIEISQPPEDPHESEKIDAALDWHYIEDCVLTAYCPCELCCGEWANNRPNGIVYTASGTQAQEGVTVAVDPDVIKLGSDVMINGHTYKAEDVGGAIKGNRIDIYVEDHEKALSMGVYNAEVFWR